MGFLDKLKQGLAKTRQAMESTLGSVFSLSSIDDDFYDELEESLIMADLGASLAAEAVEQLRGLVRERRLKEPEQAREALREILCDMLDVGDSTLQIPTRPTVVLVIGVNGVGKTTTIGKLAHVLQQQGQRVLLCAADTFRAAAADQLEIWSNRAKVDIVRQDEGADPASVVYDAIAATRPAVCTTSVI